MTSRRAHQFKNRVADPKVPVADNPGIDEDGRLRKGWKYVPGGKGATVEVNPKS